MLPFIKTFSDIKRLANRRQKTSRLSEVWWGYASYGYGLSVSVTSQYRIETGERIELVFSTYPTCACTEL